MYTIERGIDSHKPIHIQTISNRYSYNNLHIFINVCMFFLCDYKIIFIFIIDF